MLIQKSLRKVLVWLVCLEGDRYSILLFNLLYCYQPYFYRMHSYGERNWEFGAVVNSYSVQMGIKSGFYFGICFISRRGLRFYKFGA